MSEQTIIRFAKASDVERILEIYAPYIIDSGISFEFEVPTLDEFKKRFHTIAGSYPWLVCEIDGVVAGYAYASEHRSRPAYRWAVEVTVYIDEAYHRRKVGRRLYENLFRVLKEQGFCNAYAGITVSNDSSELLHKALGFTVIGTYKNVGYKMGEWYDVIWYQLELQKISNPALPKKMEDVKNFF